MYRKFICSILLCSCFVLKAQIPNNQISTSIEVFQKEIPYIVLNSNVLLSGERLHYKIHTLNESGKASSLSKVSYISLRNNKDSIILDHKLKLQNGSAYGSFFLPSSLKTGVYRILNHTNFSLNNKDNALSVQKIYIINPFTKSKDNSPKDSVQNKAILSFGESRPAKENLSTNHGISIKTDKQFYKPREKVSFSLENTNGKPGYGNYVLSVRKVNPIKIYDPTTSEKTVGMEQGNIFYIPELRGELISGKVLTLDNVPVSNKVVALSIPGEKYIFKTASTNANGQFFISIEDPYSTKNSVLQIDDLNRELYKLVLDEKRANFKETVSIPVLKVESTLKNWLQERSVQLQIQNAYFKQDSTVVEKPWKDPFYGNLGTEFILDDYTRFPTLKETFVEVVNLARIRKKNGKDALEVFDPFNPYETKDNSALNPLLILDGHLVQEVEDIFDLSAREIERIKVVPKAYRYGPKIYQGIIDFKTKEESYIPHLEETYVKAWELVEPLPKKQYYFPDYSDKSLNRIPNYSTQLFWEPNLKLETGLLAKSFYTSDVVGKYEIVVEGYTDMGKHTIAVKYIEVQ